jgi:hypothetical protein
LYLNVAPIAPVGVTIRIEQHFIAVKSISIEVNKILAIKKTGLDNKTQVLAECAGMLMLFSHFILILLTY